MAEALSGTSSHSPWGPAVWSKWPWPRLQGQSAGRTHERVEPVAVVHAWPLRGRTRTGLWLEGQRESHHEVQIK